MDNPKFTVAVSCYNIEKYVERAINSVLNQTFTDYELIVVDDCSTDSTVEIVKNMQNEKIEIYSGTKNSGTAGATRNIAIDKAKGEYIIFLDGDDSLYDENTLKNINEIVDSNIYDVIYLGYESVGADGSSYRLSNSENSTREQRLLCDTSFSVSSKCWNVDFLRRNNLKFKEGMYYEDELFSIKANILAQNTTFKEIPIFKYFRNRIGSVMTKPTIKKCSDWYRMLAEVTDLYEITPDEDKKYLLSFIKNENDSIPLRIENILDALRENRITKVLPKRNYKFKKLADDE